MVDDSETRSGLQPSVQIDDRGEVVAWGDWGWALQTESREVTLLTSGGELNETHQWVVLDSKSYGLIVHDNESLKLVVLL